MRSTWARNSAIRSLVGESHIGLTGDQPLQDVVMEGEIGAGQDRPAGHSDQPADDDPEGDRSEPNLTAAVNKSVVAAGKLAARRLSAVPGR